MKGESRLISDNVLVHKKEKKIPSLFIDLHIYAFHIEISEKKKHIPSSLTLFEMYFRRDQTKGYTMMYLLKMSRMIPEKREKNLELDKFFASI